MTKLMEDRRGPRALLEDGAHVLPDFGAVRTGFRLVVRCGGRETLPGVRPLLGLVICAERSRLLRHCAERVCRDDCGVRFQCFVLLSGRASRRPRATGSNVTSEARPAAIERWRGGAPVGIGRRVRRGVQPTAGGRRVAPWFGAATAGEPPHWKRWTQCCSGPSCEGASGGAVVCIEPHLEGLQEAERPCCAGSAQGDCTLTSRLLCTVCCCSTGAQGDQRFRACRATCSCQRTNSCGGSSGGANQIGSWGYA